MFAPPAGYNDTVDNPSRHGNFDRINVNGPLQTTFAAFEMQKRRERLRTLASFIPIPKDDLSC